MYSSKALQAFASFAKIIEDDALRSYAQVIGIRDGKAAVSNGFGLLYLAAEEFEGKQETLTKLLQPSSVKFPDFACVIPGEVGEAVNAFNLTKLVLAAKKLPRDYGQVFIRIIGGDVSLVAETVLVEGGAQHYFSAEILGHFLKGLPKGWHAERAWYVDERLCIDFAGGFRLVVCEYLAGKGK